MGTATTVQRPTILAAQWVENEVDQLRSRITEIQESCSHELVKTGCYKIVEKSSHNLRRSRITREGESLVGYKVWNLPIVMCCIKCSIEILVDPLFTCPDCLVDLVTKSSGRIANNNDAWLECPQCGSKRARH